MSKNYRVLLVEDDDQAIATFREVVAKFNEDEKDNFHIDVDSTKTKEESFSRIKNDGYSFAIIDLKLSRPTSLEAFEEEYDGNTLIRQISSQFQIPIAIYTGNPANVSENCRKMGVSIYSRATKSYIDVIREMIPICDSIMAFFGNEGILKKMVNSIFWEEIYPNRTKWLDAPDDQSLLPRYFSEIIQTLVDVSNPDYKPEEVYIPPFGNAHFRTGSLFSYQKENETKNCIVLSPRCDMEIHNENYRTTHILFCDILSMETVKKEISRQALKKGSSEEKEDCFRVELSKVLNNSRNEYYHFLPPNGVFLGGFINFRTVHSETISAIDSLAPKLISYLNSHFVSNIICRFSSYYSRQGQPQLFTQGLENEFMREFHQTIDLP